MRRHREILAAELKAKGWSHATIAKAMGFSTPSTVGHKLTGRNPWREGELQKMCELVGWTVTILASKSDDLVLTNHPETVTAARIFDAMPEAKRAAYLRLLESEDSPESDR